MLKQIEVKLIDSWHGDRNVAHSAWASTYDVEKLEKKTPQDIARVTRDIVQNVHGTPKESVWLEFFLRTPIFVERHFDKYRMTVQMQDFEVIWQEAAFGRWGITQNELSGRYRTMPERPYSMPTDVKEICKKAAFLVDQSIEYNEMVSAQYSWYISRLEALRAAEKEKLITNAEYKRAREVIRGVLGTAFFTDYRVICNLHAFEHMMNERLPPHSQLESRVTAYSMLQEVLDKQIACNTVNEMALKNGWVPWVTEIRLALQAEENSNVD